MSAVASFILVPQDSLPVLAAVAKQPAHTEDPYWGFLNLNGREVGNYEWSGYTLAVLLPYLEEVHGMRLMDSAHGEIAKALVEARGATHFVLTKEHKDAYWARLDPDGFDQAELAVYHNEFNETDEPEAGEMMKDGIRAIRDSLGQIEDSSVVVMIIE